MKLSLSDAYRPGHAHERITQFPAAYSAGEVGRPRVAKHTAPSGIRAVSRRHRRSSIQARFFTPMGSHTLRCGSGLRRKTPLEDLPYPSRLRCPNSLADKVWAHWRPRGSLSCHFEWPDRIKVNGARPRWCPLCSGRVQIPRGVFLNGSSSALMWPSRL